MRSRCDAGVSAPAASALGALVLVVALVAFLLLSGVLERDAPSAQDEQGRGIPAAAYQDVVLGVDREALTQRLRPEEPLDPRAVGRDPAETPRGDSCLYYVALGDAEDLYRFCFEDDRLVDKSVVVRDAPR
jgi:hypothetical protein